jgi:hypothetical protein
MARAIQLSVHGRSDIGRERTNNEDALVVADALTGDTTSCPGKNAFDVSILRLDLRRDDVLLLCTDGLTGEIGDDGIRDLLATTPIHRACAKLIEAANAHGGHDNITVILASVDGDGVSSPRPGDGVSAELLTSCPPPRAGTS